MNTPQFKYEPMKITFKRKVHLQSLTPSIQRDLTWSDFFKIVFVAVVFVSLWITAVMWLAHTYNF
jgi:hypothetical protein